MTARKKVTLARLRSMAQRRKPITMLTAHDFPSALRASRAGNDVVLVGDSLAQVALGYDSTTRLSMDEMVHHTRAVKRGVQAYGNTSMVVADMPFGSYHTGVSDAVGNAVRLMKDGGAEAVKLEGGREILDIIRSLSRIGIPVVGHIGLCPQRHVQSCVRVFPSHFACRTIISDFSFIKFFLPQRSGYRVQGRDAHAALALFRSAHALQRAGACMVILEAIPHQLATYITSSLVPPFDPSPVPYRRPVGEDNFIEPLPTIGIGAGPGTSGQVLVQEDMLGFWTGHRPKFVRQFMPPPYLSTPLPSSPSTAAESPIHATSIGDLALAAAEGYVHNVRTNNFPSIERGETYDMDPKEWEYFLKLVTAEESVSRNSESRDRKYFINQPEPSTLIDGRIDSQGMQSNI